MKNGMVSDQPQELVRFSLRLRDDYLSQIEKRAQRQGVSVNEMLNIAVGEYLANDDVCRCCGKPV
jgi:predicted HicB family RNase H-like nuclease